MYKTFSLKVGFNFDPTKDLSPFKKIKIKKKKFTQEFKEMDYKTCDVEFLLQWVKDKYSIF